MGNLPDHYRCPICGELQEHMTVPRAWPEDLVATWRMLERNMACLRCEGVPLPATWHDEPD